MNRTLRSDIFDAKDSITRRDFQRNFAKIVDTLKPGASVRILQRGLLVGTFTKARRPRKLPDFLENLEKVGQVDASGQAFIDDLCASS